MTYEYQTGQPSSTDGSRTDAAKDAARDTAHTAKEQVGTVAQSAKESGQHLAQQAKQQAGQVTGEAKQQASQLLGQGREQLASEASNQQQKVAGGLRSLSQELGAMSGAAQEPGVATDLVQQLGSRVDAVAEWIESREPGDLVQELKTFARNRPGTFLAIAAGAGLLAGRLTRGVKEVASDESDEQAASASSFAATGEVPVRTSAYGTVQDTYADGAAAAPSTSTYGTGAVYGETTYGESTYSDGLGTAAGSPTYGVEGTGDTAVYPEGSSQFADPYGTGATTSDYADTTAYGEQDTYGTGTQNPPSGEGQYSTGSAGYGQTGYAEDVDNPGMFGGGTGEVPEREAELPWRPVNDEEGQR